MTWSVFDIPSQTARLALVTGTGGLGFEVALGAGSCRCRGHPGGRNTGKGMLSVHRIQQLVPQARIGFEALDLASLSSIDGLVRRLAQRTDRLDLLINNAGVMMPPVRQTTTESFELQFGTNYLGHFVLTAGLLPLLRRASTARVVSVTSQACRGGVINFEDLQAKRSYNPFRAYAQSKLAQMIFAFELHRRSAVAGWGVTSSAAHPGWAKTDLFQNGPGSNSFSHTLNRLIAEPLFAQSATDGARPILFAATAPEAMGGVVYAPGGLFEMRGPPKRGKPVPAAEKATSHSSYGKYPKR